VTDEVNHGTCPTGAESELNCLVKKYFPAVILPMGISEVDMREDKKSQLFSWPSRGQKGMETFLPEDAAIRALI
jgi:hypothetical protein